METSFSFEIDENRIPYVAPPVGNLNETIGKTPSAEGLRMATSISGASGKKKVAIVLALLLGEFGVHNFYLGQKKKGIIKLLMTILSFGLLSPFVWIWSVIDAFKNS